MVSDDAAPERIGELIEVTSHALVAQSVRLHQAPPLGSFVRAAGPSGPVYAVVCEVRTTSLEAGGRPIARGYADVIDEQIYQANPDLELVLRTEFQALCVGYEAADGPRQHLPPQPPPLHYSVYACSPAEVRRFVARLDYLRALLAAGPPLADELTAANLRQAAAAFGAARDEFLVRAGRALALLLHDDYDRLAVLLRRLRVEAPA
jgi:hypothetical protein